MFNLIEFVKVGWAWAAASAIVSFIIAFLTPLPPIYTSRVELVIGSFNRSAISSVDGIRGLIYSPTTFMEKRLNECGFRGGNNSQTIKDVLSINNAGANVVQFVLSSSESEGHMNLLRCLGKIFEEYDAQALDVHVNRERSRARDISLRIVTLKKLIDKMNAQLEEYSGEQSISSSERLSALSSYIIASNYVRDLERALAESDLSLRSENTFRTFIREPTPPTSNSRYIERKRWFSAIAIGIIVGYLSVFCFLSFKYWLFTRFRLKLTKTSDF